MQPMRLGNRLRACGIDWGSSARELWRTEHHDQEAREYLARATALLLLITPFASASVAALGVAALEIKIAPLGVALGVAGSMVFGVAVGVNISVAWGVAFGVGSGIGMGVATGAAGRAVLGWVGALVFGAVEGLGLAEGLAGGVAFGVGMGMAFSVAFHEAFPSRLGAISGLGVVMAAIFGLGYVAAGGLAFGLAYGVAFGVSFIASLTRIIFYPLEGIIQAVIYFIQRTSGHVTLQFSPVLFHDLSYLPHPFLVDHILDTAPRSPSLARRLLDACAFVPGQKRIAVYAVQILQTRELDGAGRARNFAGVAELRGQWLPGSEGADPPLLALRDVARYIRATQAATQPYHRLGHLQRAERDLNALKHRLITERSQWTRLLPPVIDTWDGAVRAMVRDAEAQAVSIIPNPFRAGDPLEPDQGQELFRGRDELIRTIENLLADPSQSVSIALLGPRRCGKTSLLKMLPAMLPDTLSVLFDIQDNPIDSPARFFAAVAKRAAEQAQKDGAEIPRLPDAPPFEAASQWFRELDESRSGRRVLLCLDEFERLEKLWPGDQRELLQLMGLLRGTIQHRRNVRLLVSGAAPFHELGPLWNDHFVNVRVVRVGHLNEPTGMELLTRPIPDFPATAIPHDVAKEVFTRTGGQPYLLQLYASLLVTRLNERRGSKSTLDDVTPSNPKFSNRGSTI